MSRGLVSANETAVGGVYLEEVVLAKCEFDVPVYVHSGIGTISYDGNDYLGVGSFGAVEGARESEILGPNAVTLSLSGVDSSLLAAALDAGQMYDVITLYVGYRQDDGALVADPWIIWKGWLETSAVRLGENNVVLLTCQHDLAVLEEKDGSRFTDADQQNRYPGDAAFAFLAEMEGARLLWGGGPIEYGFGGTAADPNTASEER